MNGTDPPARWKSLLEAWAIPNEIIDAAPENPWGFPPGLFERRATSALERELTYANRKALETLPAGGSVLDVGAGGGAASLPLAQKAGSITAVDSSERMLEGFTRAAARLDIASRTVVSAWPEAAGQISPVDVVVCHHVLYNAPHIAPFVTALNDKARHRVVIEMTPQHPLVWMNDLWIKFHNLSRPDRPTYQDAVECLRYLGLDAQCHVETSVSAMGGFEKREDAIAFVRKRMCLRPEQDEELAGALGDRLRKTDRGWSASPPEHRIATLWWDT